MKPRLVNNMSIIKINSHKDGFTLIELLVVISIISLLASVVFASLNTARGKARDARRKEDLHQMQTALELYYDTFGGYPSSACPAVDYRILYSLGAQPNTATFLKPFPHDPGQGAAGGSSYNNEYLYISNSYNSCNGSNNTATYATQYTLYATLENQSTTNLTPITDAVDSWLVTNWSNPTINYKVCSPAGCI
jgi:prepilin-type N-terminal cleavage/methylation domain-containing protein